jgi:hypothetical protein
MRELAAQAPATAPQLTATSEDTRALIISLGDLRDVIRTADPAMKAAIYEQLGLKITYLPGQEKIGPT